jgi:hypothetical protein
MEKVPVKSFKVGTVFYKVGDTVFYKGLAYKVTEVVVRTDAYYYRLRHKFLGLMPILVSHFDLDEESEFEIKG